MLMEASRVHHQRWFVEKKNISEIYGGFIRNIRFLGLSIPFPRSNVVGFMLVASSEYNQHTPKCKEC
jgi:hypothetical protein